MWEAAETTGDKHAKNMVPTVMRSLDHSTAHQVMEMIFISMNVRIINFSIGHCVTKQCIHTFKVSIFIA